MLPKVVDRNRPLASPWRDKKSRSRRYRKFTEPVVLDDMGELRELCEGLAEATDDVTYLKMFGVDNSLAELGDE